MKYRYISAALLLPIMVFLHCGSKSTAPDIDKPAANKITLGAGSELLSRFTIQAHSGATLTIDSGTTVLMLDSAGVFEPVPAGDNVLVYLDDGDSNSVVNITGVTTVALFRITATVNGAAAELRFLSPAAPTTAGMPVTGAHWTATLSDTAIHAGTRITLYKISGSADTLIGSHYNGIPTKVLAKMGPGGNQTNVSPNGTGSYQAGANNGGAASSSGTIPSSGVYWNTYSNIPDTSIVIGSDTFGGPLTVEFLETGELSTSELVAGFTFEGSATSATWTNPNDGAQYWAELTQSAEGKTTSIKIAATVANIFYLSMNLVNATTRTPVLSVTGLQPDGSGVHAPDGSVLADPYQDASLKFGGFKELKFATKNYSEGTKIEGKVRDAGYQISHSMYENKVYQFDVALTLDGRKLIEEQILQKNGWFPRPATATWRNRGFYDYNDSLFINISSHGTSDTVKTLHQTVTGTFTNAAGDPDTVTKMTVLWTNLGSTMKTVDATLSNGGTSFSFDCDLYTSDNIFIFQPYMMDQYGQETYQTHQIIKAQGTKTRQFIVNYKEHRNGVLIIHQVTTTRANDPDTSVAIDDETVTANLTLTPNQIILNDILTNAGSAATCASSQSCSVLDGISDSTKTVLVSEQYQLSTRNCDHNLPILLMDWWNGSVNFNNCPAHVYASLLPPGTGTRQYCLVVQIQPTLQMQQTPNNAGNGQTFVCIPDSAWKAQTANIWPHILLTKSDNPIILQFGSATTLEDYVTAPDGGASWTLSGTQYSADSMSVTQYDATLTVSAP
jgi:hypothetical protein